VIIYLFFSSPFKTGTSGASRLCKAAFLHRFREACVLIRNPALAQVRTYREAKEKAVSYVQAKETLVHFLAENYGYWIKKPIEVELFQQ
jgi:hypothetical protein